MLYNLEEKVVVASLQLLLPLINGNVTSIGSKYKVRRPTVIRHTFITDRYLLSLAGGCCIFSIKRVPISSNVRNLYCDSLVIIHIPSEKKNVVMMSKV